MSSRYEAAYRRMAAEILTQYEGQVSFAVFLKQWFKQHPNAGSRDRREVARRCYGWFRLGKYPVGDDELRMAMAENVHALCDNAAGTIESLSQLVTNSRLIFPAVEKVSPLINHDEFFAAHFCQPNVFIRTRPRYDSHVKAVLKASGMEFGTLAAGCVHLTPNAKLPQELEVDKQYVVQDWASQQSGATLSAWLQSRAQRPQVVYDCCAASGGKTILANDLLNPSALFASDVRPSIIHNLRSRLKRAGIQRVSIFQHDFCNPPPLHLQQHCDLLIADVPCSGSGTWARTPEQLLFFSPDKIEHYTNLQKQIVDNASGTLKRGGFLYYITCSVYAAENEAQVKLLVEKGFTLLGQQYAEGAGLRADTMFMALLQRP